MCISIDVNSETYVPNNNNPTEHLVNIPSSNAAEALNLLAEQTDALLIFPYDIAESRTAKAVSGNYSIKEALDLMLNDSGLIAEISDKGVIRVSIMNNVDTTNKQRSEMKTQKTILASILAMFFSSNINAQEQNQTSAAAEEAEIIEVVGIRGSLEKATEVKRGLDVVADVISAEDIGKFPDQNLAESLQRISGVQISRNRGEGRDVTVRGLSPDFTRVQFNGRTLPSATGGRSFDFTILPSDFVSALEVYKTPSADMEEGALSATVNVKTPRPLARGVTSLVTSVKALRESNSGDINPDVSALYNFVNDDQTFGMTLGAHYDSRAVESHIFQAFGLERGVESSRGPTSNIDYNQDGDFDDVYRFNHGFGTHILNEDRERTTLLATLEFRPNTDTNIWLETMYSEFDIQGAYPVNAHRWTNIRGSVIGSEIVSDPLGSDGFLERMEVAGVDHRNNARTTDSNDKLTSFSIGGKHTLSEDWVIETELSHAKSENVVSALAHAVIGRVDAYYDFSNNYAGIPDVGYLNGSNHLDPSIFRSVGFNGLLDSPTEDTSTDFRVDVEHFVDWGVGIYSLEFGAKYTQREKFNGFRRLAVSGAALAGLLGETFDPTIEGGSFDASAYMTRFNPSGFFDGYSGPSNFPTEFLAAETNTILDLVSIPELIAAGSITEGGAREIKVNEDVTAAYAKVNFEGMDDRLSGNFGIRIVSTSQESAGNIPDFSTITFDQGGAVTNVDTSESSISRSYTEVLPSLNLKYELTDEVLLRFGAARVMSRPSLDILSPATTININVGSINSKNPNVDPFLADQLDFSAEWYFEDGGMLSVSPFVKFIKSFVVNATNDEPVTYTDVGSGETTTTTLKRFLPDNGKGSDLTGIEFNYQQPLDMLVEGLGFTANYTMVDADNIQTSEDGPLLPLKGLSKTSYNLVAYYENDTFGARLAYNFRDGFINNNGDDYFGDGSLTDDYSQLDFSASYNVTEDISIDFEALNITEEVIMQKNSLGINRGVEDVGSRFTVGVRASF
jgi:iron complex outermembrane receptor protein